MNVSGDGDSNGAAYAAISFGRGEAGDFVCICCCMASLFFVDKFLYINQTY